MFGRNKRPSGEDTDMTDETTEKAEQPTALPLKSGSDAPPATGAPAPVRQPEVVRAMQNPRAGRQATGSVSNPEGKRLIVGEDIELSGSINACDKLIVEGRVEANLNDCREIEIAATGTFKGEADIEVADISGTFEGTLTAKEVLVVRATGRIIGTVRFGKLEIERGGEIVGDIGTVGTKAAAE